MNSNCILSTRSSRNVGSRALVAVLTNQITFPSIVASEHPAHQRLSFRSDLRLSINSSIIRLSSQIYSSPSVVDLIYLPTIGDSVSRSLNPSACLILTEPRHPTSRNPHPMYASSALLFTTLQPRRQPFSAILPLDRAIIPQMATLLTTHSGLVHLMPKYYYPYNGPRMLHDVSPSIN